jgi:hypothetical protein
MLALGRPGVLTSDLILPKYRRDDCAVAGACYIMSEALWHLYAKYEGFVPTRATRNGVTHWWLQKRAKAGTVVSMLDLTAEQFDMDEWVRYFKAGRGGGFLTKEPSKRARVLMERALAEANR